MDGRQMPNDSETTFIVSLSKGMANRNRLPLQHVMKVLTELQDALKVVGRRIQSERGAVVDGDFGIELLANDEGIVFHKGSVRAEAAITRDVANGVEAMRRVMQTMSVLERKRPASLSDGSEPIVQRLATIAEIQKSNSVELSVELRTPGKKRPEFATFGQSGIATTEKIEASESSIKGLTVYGKLRELRDRSMSAGGGRFFWGELITDKDEVWRARFRAADESKAVPLFRKRVVVTGDATYYRANTPRIDVQEIKKEKVRNYDAAFKKLYGLDRAIYGKDDFDELIAEIRGDD
jgi:hypothetical protein